MFDRLKKWRAQRAARIDLNHLDPHLLRDIGFEADQFRDPMADRAAMLAMDGLHRHRRK